MAGTSSQLMQAVTQPPVLGVNFAQVTGYPATKARLGFAQNMNSLGQGLEGVIPYLVALGANGYTGACEFDVWYKHPGDINPCLDSTYDANGRAITMTTTPTTTVTSWAQSLNNANISINFQLIGPVPEYQITTSYEPRRHPPPTNYAAHCAKVAQWIHKDKWPCPINWSLWNEGGRTQLDCKKGFGLNNEVINENQAEYEVRRATLKEQAAYSLRDLYIGTFKKDASNDIGKWSTASMGSLLSGDTRDGGGRTMIDGRTFRAGWWDVYDTFISQRTDVFLNTYACHNDFGNRGPNIVGNSGDFNGADYPIWFNQGGPMLLKTELDGEGGEDQDPAPDTHMGPACEMMTMMLGDANTPSVAMRCLSYLMGGIDGFVSYVSPGVYLQRHRYTAIMNWSKVPSRRVFINGVTPEAISDGSLYSLQGPLAVAGIDPSGKYARLIVWNERPYDVPMTIGVSGLPPALEAAPVTYHVQDEDNPAGFTRPYTKNMTLAMGPRTIHTITWKLQDPTGDRRNPLHGGSHSPKLMARLDESRRAKNTAGIYDTVRGEAWLIGNETYPNTIRTGATYQQTPDQLFATLWMHNVDADTPVRITARYSTGATKVLFLSSTTAIQPGTVVALDMLAQAPNGWSTNGVRECSIYVELYGNSNSRVECWFSGTLQKANAVAGI